MYNKDWFDIGPLHPAIQQCATYSSILCFNFLCICQVFIEEKEGKKEEDTGAVQGTLGPSASYIYIKNPF